MSVVPECQATTSAGDESETYLSITLSTNISLMCVEGYQIQFSGESKNVLLQSPSVTFTINATNGQPFQNEITVYTLDFENRTGVLPCTFNVAGEFPCMT